MGRLHPDLQTFVPSETAPWDRVKAAHLLNRAGFGATPADVTRALEMGPRRAVDWLLDFPDAPADEQSATDVPDLSGIEGYPRTFAERRRAAMGKTPEERQMLFQQFQRGNREAIAATMQWWLKRMAAGANPLQEKLTLFWHGHFTTSVRDERSAWLMWQQNETLRTHSAGNFGAFVKAISRDPAMLDYLNNQQNRKGRPNENYARELMELFTLGIGNYTEQDIKEAARAFTGWGHDGEDFVFRRGDHDFGEKTFMNRRGDFDGDDIIDLLLRHPACAPYIAGRLWSFFAYEQAEPALIASLGEVLAESKYELRPLLRTMLLSKAFYGERAVGTQIKSPVQLMTGTARALEVEFPPLRQLQGVLDQMGQVPLAPPNVKGWPGGRAWINTSTLFVRQNAAIGLVKQASTATLAPPGARTPAQVVEGLVDRLLQRPLAAERVDVIVKAMGGGVGEQAVRKAAQLVVSLPEFQLC